jgi:hypothetical protein
MIAVLAIVILTILWSLERRSRNAHSKINLDDLLVGDDNRLSKAAAVMMGSFAMTTWVIVYLALNNHLTEGYFSAYIAAWVAPAVAKIIKGTAPTPTPQVGDTPA